MARNEYPTTDWEQMSLTRPDRVHVRFDCYLVPGASTLGVTTTVWDGAERTMVAMKAQGFPIEGTYVATIAQELEEILKNHWIRCEPF